jgi:hypothetical protein
MELPVLVSAGAFAVCMLVGVYANVQPGVTPKERVGWLAFTAGAFAVLLLEHLGVSSVFPELLGMVLTVASVLFLRAERRATSAESQA